MNEAIGWFHGWWTVQSRGSRTSGNYGHKGRKGQRGGSLPGAGHTTIGVTPAMSKEEIAQAIDAHQEARAKEKGKMGPLIRKRLEKVDAKYEARALALMQENGELNFSLRLHQDEITNLYDMRERVRKQGAGQASIDFWSDQIEKTSAKGEVMFNRSIEVSQELHGLRQEQRQAMLDVLSVPKSQQANVTMDTRIRLNREGVQKGVDAFNQLVGTGTVDGQKVSVGRTNDRRAAYVPIGSPKNSGRVVLSKGDSATTMLHEMGHWLEDRDPKIHQKALAFLDRRTKGETAQKLSILTRNSNYKDREIAKPDKFMTPYSGKIYEHSTAGRYATEIISMGLQHMYVEAATFAKRDPDFFDFMISVLRD